jgi:hypothetical protein
MRNPFKMYLFYYYPMFCFIWQYGDVFKYSGMDFYRYFKIKFNIFSPRKTRLPGVCLEVIILGVGFYCLTHQRK